MYTMTFDNKILHDPRVQHLKTVVKDPKLTLEINKQGTLTFDILPTHPYYSDIHKLKSEITVYQDNEWLWSGRVLNDNDDMNRIKSCSCEGELAYLLDSIQELAEYHDMSVENYFKRLISVHNSQVDENKRFTVGTVNVVDNNDSLYRFSNYEKTWNCINEKLIDKLGGYIRTRREGNQKIIDYISDYGNVNTQVIQFGKNLLTLKHEQKGEEVATVLIPLGARIESETGASETVERRVTIASVNGGKTYVEDSESIELYGRIFDTVIFDNVNDPAILMQKGRSELAVRRLLSDSIELTALDLHHLNVEVERIKLGDSIRVLSIPHGIDIYMTVTKMVIDLNNVANTVITLGKTTSTLTEITSSINQKAVIQQVVQSYGFDEKINGAKEEVKNVSFSLISLGERVDGNTATKEEVQALAEAVNALNEKLSESGGNLNFNAPSIFKNGLTIDDNGTTYNVLEILKNIGGNS